jgi:glucose-1-phosphate cytidylyltransferase
MARSICGYCCSRDVSNKISSPICFMHSDYRRAKAPSLPHWGESISPRRQPANRLDQSPSVMIPPGLPGTTSIRALMKLEDLKVVILAGGYGTRLAEETVLRPKPMVEIGGQPLLWHLMKFYSHFGLRRFIILLGYKGIQIKEYFASYLLHQCDVTIHLANGAMAYHNSHPENWEVTLLETGADSMTGGRLKRAAAHLKHEKAFCMTYGDGLSDVDLQKLYAYHQNHGRLATMTTVQAPARWGHVVVNGQNVVGFQEKPTAEDAGAMINGGFFVLSPRVLDTIDGDHTSWEVEPLAKLVAQGELAAYRHRGFWQAMDTLREKNMLEVMWQSGKAPWKVWS